MNFVYLVILFLSYTATVENKTVQPVSDDFRQISSVVYQITSYEGNVPAGEDDYNYYFDAGSLLRNIFKNEINQTASSLVILSINIFKDQNLNPLKLDIPPPACS